VTVFHRQLAGGLAALFVLATPVLGGPTVGAATRPVSSVATPPAAWVAQLGVPKDRQAAVVSALDRLRAEAGAWSPATRSEAARALRALTESRRNQALSALEALGLSPAWADIVWRLWYGGVAPTGIPPAWRPFAALIETALKSGRAAVVVKIAQWILAAPAPPSRSAASMVLGYYVPGPAAWADLVAHAGELTAIAPLWYSVRPDGTVHLLASHVASVTAWCHAHGVAVFPLVINGYGNDAVLLDAALRRTAIATLVGIAKRFGFNGFNLDFEGLSNPDEGPLDTFVAEFSQALHAAGLRLIVSVGARTSATAGYHVYNYGAIGQAADWVDLMTYDDHDNGGPAGPVAPLGWVDAVVRYAEATIPASKILVGLAGYGYDWSSVGATEVSAVQALALAQTHGATWVGGSVQEPEIQYTDSQGIVHTVWFEDSASEAAKVALVTHDHLGGVALWDLGEENAGVWPMLARMLGR
jgi:spore germination protein YaaH